jgi:hypothetical protein
MDILPSQFKIKNREDLMDDCLDQVKGMVAALKEGKSLGVKREANSSDHLKPIFTVFTKGIVDLSGAKRAEDEAKRQMQEIVDEWIAGGRNPNYGVGAAFLEHVLKIMNGEIELPEAPQRSTGTARWPLPADEERARRDPQTGAKFGLITHPKTGHDDSDPDGN